MIIHFHPLERFPPALNLINFLSAERSNRIIVITTRDKKGSGLRTYENRGIRIIRTPAIVPGSVMRLFNYFRFYFTSLSVLIISRAKVVLYYETLSSWPALIYKKIRKNKVALFVHYHEYTQPGSDNQMWLVNKIHQLEKKMYPDLYQWISHTNEVRMEQFKKDNQLKNNNPCIFHTMPNYPPVTWTKYQNNFGSADRIRLIFIGSLGYDNMYLKEIIEWAIVHEEKFTLDFYSYNIDIKAREFLNGIDTRSIRFHAGKNYDELPVILRNYDVGLVLYKPYNFNHVNGISNKVYEYLACGLDVWFPKDNTYMLSMVNNKYFPRIEALDFKDLSAFDFESALNRNSLINRDGGYFAESVYKQIAEVIKAY